MIIAPEEDKLNYYSKQIEKLREQMIKTAMDLGLNHPRVLQFSKEIDENHNKLLKLKTRKF